jgi:hypothetical protein
LIAVSVGTINSVAKKHEMPSSRFLIGSGAAFLILSALAEAEPEVAKALAFAIATTVVIGQGDGVLSYLNQRGEIDTQKQQQQPSVEQPHQTAAPQQRSKTPTLADARPRTLNVPTITPMPGMP